MIQVGGLGQEVSQESVGLNSAQIWSNMKIWVVHETHS